VGRFIRFLGITIAMVALIAVTMGSTVLAAGGNDGKGKNNGVGPQGGKGPNEHALKNGHEWKVSRGGQTQHLYLYEKDADWKVVEEGAWGKYNYKLAEKDENTEVTGIFNAHGLEAEVSYSLIYYPEVAPNPWPAEGVEVFVIGTNTACEFGNVHISGTATIGLPDEQPEAGDYNGQTGDKIWLVLTGDLSEIEEEDGNIHTYITGWNPGEYLFESELINTGE